jgi:hypothetical protein
MSGSVTALAGSSTRVHHPRRERIRLGPLTTREVGGTAGATIVGLL